MQEDPPYIYTTTLVEATFAFCLFILNLIPSLIFEPTSLQFQCSSKVSISLGLPGTLDPFGSAETSSLMY